MNTKDQNTKQSCQAHTTQIYIFNEYSCLMHKKEKVCQTILEETKDNKDKWMVVIQLIPRSGAVMMRYRELAAEIQDITGVNTQTVSLTDNESIGVDVVTAANLSSIKKGHKVILFDENLNQIK